MDAQALLGDEYFSSISDPFPQDWRGPRPPPATPREARASAVAEGGGNVLATARVASLELVDAQSSARAMSGDGRGAIAQADTGYEARDTTMVDATSSLVEAGFGALHSVSVHAEADGGVGPRAAASLSAEGLIEDLSLAPVGLLVVAQGAPLPSQSAITETTSITLSEVQLIDALAAHSTLRATSTSVLDAQGLNPFADLFVSYIDNGAATDNFTFDLLLDDISLWQLGFGALNAASATGAVNEIDLGMVGALMNSDLGHIERVRRSFGEPVLRLRTPRRCWDWWEVSEILCAHRDSHLYPGEPVAIHDGELIHRCSPFLGRSYFVLQDGS